MLQIEWGGGGLRAFLGIFFWELRTSAHFVHSPKSEREKRENSRERKREKAHFPKKPFFSARCNFPLSPLTVSRYNEIKWGNFPSRKCGALGFSCGGALQNKSRKLTPTAKIPSEWPANFIASFFPHGKKGREKIKMGK